MIQGPRFSLPVRQGVNVVGLWTIGRQHDRTLSRNQRKRLNLFIRLARRQGGLRCQGTYLVACYYCAWWLPLQWATIEHLVNRRDGGRGQENLRLVHWRCNAKRNQREQAILSNDALAVSS
jgi:hypothetical protein